MCTRFVYRGDDVITGFNFDIDLAQWDHRVMVEEERFYIGILRPDGARHGYHGVHRNGNTGTLLYVPGNPAGAYRDGEECLTVAQLTEQFLQARISFEDALRLVQTKRIVYAPDATMQAMLSDQQGRTLVVEPGIGWREDRGRYSLMTNGSLLAPESTRPFLLPGDDRYQRADRLLRRWKGRFSVDDAFALLRAVRQEGRWATRVSFVYSSRERTVYYQQGEEPARIQRHRFLQP